MGHLQNQLMLPPRKILAANLATLMTASRRLSRLTDLVAASDGRLSNGTVGRIKTGNTGTNVDNLGEIANVFGIEAWQLLYPGLRAETRADGEAVVVGLPDWPFEMVEGARYFSLHEPERAYVQAKLSSAIEEREQAVVRKSEPPDRLEQLARDNLLPATPRRQSPAQSRRRR